MSLSNPWLDLPSSPEYVLPCDRATVDVFGVNESIDSPARLVTDLLPEPWVGSLDAPVILLGLNPGFDPGDYVWQAAAAYRARLLACLVGESQGYPFYHLAPGATGPAALWWRRALGPLLSRYPSEERVRNRLLCLEYFPYHSRVFAHTHLRLPSQAFTFEVLRNALRRNAVVIAMRGMKIWLGAVPELAHHPRLFRASNPQRFSLSPGNCHDAWSHVLSALDT